MCKLIYLHRRSQLFLFFVIACSLSACATISSPSSQIRIKQLRDAHFAFIDHHTRAAGTPATDVQWDQAGFDAEVARINQQFADAEAAEPKAVPARKEFIKNSAELFRRDAEFVREKHSLSPAFAANKKKQLQQNYDLMLKSEIPH